MKNYHYIVDAIDMVTSKIALIDYAYKNNIRIISAMGAGNRIDVPECVVGDIFETSNDGLAKVLRQNLRKLNIKEHTAEGYFPKRCLCFLSIYLFVAFTRKVEFIIPPIIMS